MCGVLQTADSKELFIILPQTSHRFQSNEAPFFKVNIRIFEHKVKPFYEWIWCLGFISALWWRPTRVQMEYLQKEYFPFKTVIIDESLQITLEKNYQVSFGIFLFPYLYSYRYHSSLHGAS